MGLLDILFREKGSSLSSSGYAAVGVTNGGSKWGFAHHDKRAIEIPRVIRMKDIAAAYTVVKNDTGSMLVATAALTVTLPAPDSTWRGVYVDVFVKADVDVVIATATADTLVTFNDLAADSVSYATSAEKIGAASRFICDGVLWYHIPMVNEAATVTTVTA